MLLLARYSGANRWLDTPLPEYLGKISYSLYLIHGTVLFATVILLYGHLPTPAGSDPRACGLAAWGPSLQPCGGRAGGPPGQTAGRQCAAEGGGPVNTPEQELASRTTSGRRYFELDALRGLAAVIVVFHHTRLFFFTGEPRWFLKPFFGGINAVLLFFVLSGYVLSLSFWRGRELPYPQYLVRRCFRIYVPYAAACLLAVAVGRHLLNAQLPLTPWFYGTWHAPLTWRTTLAQLLKMSQDTQINTAFWSLRYEVQLSIVFPVLCRLLTRLRPAGSLIAALICFFAGQSLGAFYAHGWRSEIFRTIMLSSCFMLGALMAWQGDRLAAAYARLPPWGRYGLWVPALLYFSARTDRIILGACLLLLLARYSAVHRWLDTPVPEYLGKISYSLYLVHGTALFATVILLYGRMPTPLVVAIGIGASFALGHLFNLLVEEPADRLGKRLARGMQQTARLV